MLKLTEYEKSLAFDAIWDISFTGIAIIDKDYRFICVNNQFLTVSGVTPAQCLGIKITDITPVSIREIDIKNAELVKSGTITSYMIPKSFEFSNGHKVDVILLVKGVYCRKSGQFLFFVSRIMEKQRDDSLSSQSLKRIGLLEWIDKSTIGMAFLGLMAAFGYGVMQYIIELIRKN